MCHLFESFTIHFQCIARILSSFGFCLFVWPSSFHPQIEFRYFSFDAFLEKFFIHLNCQLMWQLNVYLTDFKIVVNLIKVIESKFSVLLKLLKHFRLKFNIDTHTYTRVPLFKFLRQCHRNLLNLK